MPKESMIQISYEDYVLDVTDVNTVAICCYSALGFKEVKRINEKHSKQKGFSAKIHIFLHDILYHLQNLTTTNKK